MDILVPKHVEQIISALKHSVASGWFSFLRLKTSRLKNFKGKVTLFDLPKGCEARRVLLHYAQNTTTKVLFAFYVSVFAAN